ncbi:MAG: adenylate/guanylate cyclase domain-containing protein [Opitutaceae bacterium]
MSKKRQFRLKITLPLAVIGLICSAAALVIGVNQMNYASSMQRMADRQMKQVSAETRKELSNFHTSATELLYQVEKILGSRLQNDSEILLAITNQNELQPYFLTVLEQNPKLKNLYIGDSDGNFVMLRQESGNRELRIRRHEGAPSGPMAAYQHPVLSSGQMGPAAPFPNYTDFDPRKRPWYIEAMEQNDVNWTSAYRFFSGDQLGVTLSAPVKVEGQTIAVVGFDYEIDSLSTVLEDLVRRDRGIAFLVDARGHLVAHSQKEWVYAGESGELPLAGAIDHLPTKKAISVAGTVDVGAPQNVFSSQITADSKGFFVEKSPIEWRRGSVWQLFVVIPEEVFMGDVDRSNRFVLLASFVGILICVGGGWWISELISRPLESLTRTTERIRDFHLDDERKVNSVFQEVDRIAESIDRMRIGLRSFARFVPADLVRQLIATNTDASRQGQQKELTILFSDMIEFTGFSETVDSDRLTVFLGDYFTELTDVIQSKKGTIDKFIGDSVLAFWNAPADCENHAILACEAALICQETLSEFQPRWAEQGYFLKGTRIGIHTGTVTVGNVGSAKRMEYTVIGDPVNLANRIESLGKYYGTKIIISEATLAQIGDHYVTRKLDEVIAFGKSESIHVFELVGRQNEVPAETLELIALYEAGLKEYFNHDWPEAERYFRLALKIEPDDQATKNMQVRCLEGRASSKMPGWIAAYQPRSK